jgi:hypothetical protein
MLGGSIMEQIINLGKIPVKYRFAYTRTLQLLLAENSNKDSIITQHTDIVENIEKEIKPEEKIKDFKQEDWAFTIDSKYNFLAISKDYLNKHFNDKGE